jgi:glycosyltransferase involved in cell wall biosynthesis
LRDFLLQRSSPGETAGAIREPDAEQRACELTVLMPCLNEAATLGTCIAKARAFMARSGVSGEVVVADNGSTDGSQAIARANGARVVDVGVRGYGSALMGGMRAARGRFVVMGDSDDSYDFERLELFIDKLREGYDLVMGNRFRGGIEPGAMPTLHRYLGNPVLTTVGRLLFGSACGDFHCGLRGASRDAMLRLDLRAPGMEFASEMVVKATLAGLRITEVPTTLSPDGRNRPPHLRSWRDGWRHLRFLLLFSPRWLFLYPGFALFVAGAMGMMWLLPQPRTGSLAQCGASPSISIRSTMPPSPWSLVSRPCGFGVSARSMWCARASPCLPRDCGFS